MTRAYLDALTRPQLTEMVMDIQSARDADRAYARRIVAELRADVARLERENLDLYRRLDKPATRRRQKVVSYSEEVDFETLSPDEQIAWITLHPEQVSAHTT